MNKHILWILIFLSGLGATSAQAEYLSILSGYQISEHSYLTDSSNQEGAMLGAALDTQHWRRHSTGWLARGPRVELKQSTGYLEVSGQLPVYQWDKHNGSWLEISWIKQTFQTTLSEAQTFLGNDGTSTSLDPNTIISTERQLQQFQLYWLESSKNIGALNLFGIHYAQETSPVAGELSSTSASYFDGKFTGYGLVFGRSIDKRGLNFQWRLNMGKSNSGLSNSITQHRTLSSSESSVFKLSFKLQWHYRYYLAPYWYLAPHLQVTFNALMQGQSETQQISHDTYTYHHAQSWLSLRHYF